MCLATGNKFFSFIIPPKTQCERSSESRFSKTARATAARTRRAKQRGDDIRMQSWGFSVIGDLTVTVQEEAGKIFHSRNSVYVRHVVVTGEPQERKVCRFTLLDGESREASGLYLSRRNCHWLCAR
jgi:hypothetical protein